ncbi:MAG: hypothetical protein WBG86_16250, partial [Polyangiales bacterium]
CDGRAIVGAGCSPDPCEPSPPMPAACCNGTECSVRTPDACTAQGGTSLLGAPTCDQDPCDKPGACCVNDGSCIEVDSPDCEGVYVSGMATVGPFCTPQLCNGACCNAENECSIGSAADCGDGDFIGARTTCDPDPCEDRVGACCEPEGCVERFRSECEELFFLDLACDPDPCFRIAAEVTELCAGVTQNEGISSLAWSFAIASTVSLAGEALALEVEGPGDPITAEGVVDDEGRVRIDEVAVAAFGTYAYEVLSVGSAALSGDLDGDVVVDGSEKPCPSGAGGTGGSDGGSNPYAGCMERPPGSVACECDPFDDNCSGNLECSINFFVDGLTQEIESVPALDGSECCPATECISNVIQTVGAGGACNIFLAGTLRRDDCLPGLFCDPQSEDLCVPLCLDDAECADNSCERLSLANPGFGSLGRCSQR